MDRHVSAREANQHFSQLLAAAEAGETIIVTKRGKPCVKITKAKPDFDPEEQKKKTQDFLAFITKHAKPLGIEKFNRAEVYEERIARYDRKKT